MSTPLVYRGLQTAGRILLKVYFRTIEVGGASPVPQGPVIFAANHPQSITDALVLGFGVRRPVRFLAHSGLFRHPLRGWGLRQARCIPVHRREDETQAAEKNIQAFSDCYKALAEGDAIGIFPEGASREGRRVYELKTGTARIALEAEAHHGFRLGVRIVPVGIHFEDPGRFRSRVLLNLGQPIEVAAYAESYAEDSRRTVITLTDALKSAIASQVVHLEREELDRLLEDVEDIYKEVLIQTDTGPGEASRLNRDLSLSREMAAAVDYYAETRPEILQRLQPQLKAYRRKRNRLRLADPLLSRSRDPSFRRELLKAGLVGVLGLFPALYGALFNSLPYRLTGWLAARSAPDQTKVHWFQLSFGAVIYTLYYGLLFYLVSLRLGVFKTGLFAISLVPAGLFARWYREELGRRRDAVRFAYLTLTRGYHIQRLRTLRDRIIGDMNAVRADYLRRRETPRHEESTG